MYYGLPNAVDKMNVTVAAQLKIHFSKRRYKRDLKLLASLYVKRGSTQNSSQRFSPALQRTNL